MRLRSQFTSSVLFVYTYYSAPWRLVSGDDVRIHSICSALCVHLNRVIVFTLDHTRCSYAYKLKDCVYYVHVPRWFYKSIAGLLKWKNQEDLNPLIKLTHYVDEFMAVIKVMNVFRRSNFYLVFGSMTLFSFFAHLLGLKGKIVIYDPLANYSQTLYLRSRTNINEFLRYGLYLALHKLQLRSSTSVIYPSEIDLVNAKRMFKVNRTAVVPNPYPICFESIDEYLKLRSKRGADVPHFILLAGGRAKANEEAVKTTIEVFNGMPPDKFRLYITGPWDDMKKQVRNPSINILGRVPYEELKKYLAEADYGLSPVFSHAAGTFLKTLAYVASGLNIIATPQSLQGIGFSALRNRKVFIVKNQVEYRRAIEEALSISQGGKPYIITCDSWESLWRQNVANIIELATYDQ